MGETREETRNKLERLEEKEISGRDKRRRRQGVRRNQKRKRRSTIKGQAQEKMQEEGCLTEEG